LIALFLQFGEKVVAPYKTVSPFPSGAIGLFLPLLLLPFFSSRLIHRAQFSFSVSLVDPVVIFHDNFQDGFTDFLSLPATFPYSQDALSVLSGSFPSFIFFFPLDAALPPFRVFVGPTEEEESLFGVL